MPSHNDSRRYYWLKLKEDFFEDEAIEWLEEQKNGSTYALFYLKLCLKALKNDGMLIRHVGTMLIPYDTAKLAEITRTSEDTVIVSLELMKKIGLVEVRDDGAIYMSQLNEMVGSETRAAARQRKHRKKLKGCDNVTLESQKSPLLCTQEYRDKSIEYRGSSSNEPPQPPQNEMAAIYSFYESNFSTISSFIAERLDGLAYDYSFEWVMKAMERCVEGGRAKCNISYLEGVLRGWKADGYAKPWTKVKEKEPTDGPHVTYRNGLRFENGVPVINSEEDGRKWQEIKDEDTRRALEEINQQGTE